MYMHILVTLIIIVEVFVLHQLLRHGEHGERGGREKRLTEKFESVKFENVRDCSVYFTENVKDCDEGVYDPHVLVYKIQLTALMDQIDKVRGPTDDQAKQMNNLNTIIAEYTNIDRKAGAVHSKCKANLAPWKQFKQVGFTNDSIPVLGDLALNANKGSPANWAFCTRPYSADQEESVAKLKAISSVSVDSETDGTLRKYDIDGTPSIRVSFNSFKPEDVKKLFCFAPENAFGPSTQIDNGLVLTVNERKEIINVEVLASGVLKNLTDSNRLSDEEIDKMFRPMFVEEKVVDNTRDILAMNPSFTNSSIVVQDKNLCGKVSATVIGGVDIRFKTGIQVKALEITETNRHIQGGVSDMQRELSAQTAIAHAKEGELALAEHDATELVKEQVFHEAVVRSLTVRALILKYLGTNEVPAIPYVLQTIRSDDGSVGVLLGDANRDARMRFLENEVDKHNGLVKALKPRVDLAINVANIKRDEINGARAKVDAIGNALGTVKTLFRNGVRQQLGDGALEMSRAIDPALISWDGKIYIKL